MLRFVSVYIVISALCIAPALPAQPPAAYTENPIEAKVNKNKVVTGELFSYSLRIKGNFSVPKLTLPEFKDLKVVSTNQARNYSFQGSSTKIEVVINCILVATKPGVFTIKEATLEDKHNKFSTPPITIEVTGKPLEEKRRALPYVENGTEI